MQFNNNNIAHYADIVAIPMFLLSSIYFYNIDHKNNLEYILLFFSLTGFILDILFTLLFLSKR